MTKRIVRKIRLGLVKRPRIVSELPGPKSEMLWKRYTECVTPAFPRRVPVLTVVEAEGIYIKDLDGNIYMDFTAGGHHHNAGFSHPKVLEAVRRQMEKTHTSDMDFAVHEPWVLLAEKLKEIAPGRLSKGKVGFCNIGTDATEYCMKLARKYTGKILLMGFQGGYHGFTFGALSLSLDNAEFRRHILPLLPGVVYAPFAYCYRCSFGQEYPGCGLQCVDYVRYILETVAHPDEVAAIFTEPIQAHGGVIVPPPDFLPEVKKICDENGILFINDEVVTGFGRTGTMFGISQWKVEPDVMYMGKPIASGMPMAAIIARREIMDEWKLDLMSGFPGHPLSCVSALATIEVIQEEKLAENSIKIGNYTMKLLSEMQEKYPLIGDVRGRGLLIGAELVKDPKTKTPAKEETEEILTKALRKGLIMVSAGTYHNVLKFYPSMNITKEQVDIGMEILEQSIREVTKEI